MRSRERLVPLRNSIALSSVIAACILLWSYINDAGERQTLNRAPLFDSTKGGEGCDGHVYRQSHQLSLTPGEDLEDFAKSGPLGGTHEFSLSRVYPERETSISGCCHILLLYGMGPTDLPDFVSGESALRLLLSESNAIQAIGKSPFVRTRHGIRYHLVGDPIFESDAGEAHRDQCLATFAAISLPLNTPIKLNASEYVVADLLRESIANFALEQKEIEWTAMSLVKYLPPERRWTNRFGEETSFSQLTLELIGRNSNQESCAGVHVFQALVEIDREDKRHDILDRSSRKALDSYLRKTVSALTISQSGDGSWGWNWCKLRPGPRGMTPFEMNFLVTGHLTEVLVGMDADRRPPFEVCNRGIAWLRKSLAEGEFRKDRSWVCPYTHAARAVLRPLPRY